MRSFILLTALLVACGGSQTKTDGATGGGSGGGDGTGDGTTGDGTDVVDDGTGVVVTGEAPKMCVDVTTLDDEDYIFPYSDLLTEAVGIEAKPDPSTWIVEAMGNEDEYTIIEILHIHDGTWVVLYAHCTGKPSCSIHMARAAQVAADDRYEIKQTVDFTFDEQPFGEMAEGLEPAGIGFADFNEDKSPELWVFLDVSGEPQAAVGETTHSYMAVYTLPDLKELAWTKIGTRPGGSYEDGCTSYVSLYDMSCDDHPDVLVSTECGMLMCLDNPDDPECASNPNSFSRESMVWMPDVSRFFAASHDWDWAAIEKARGGE
jgi:hypothetical protein